MNEKSTDKSCYLLVKKRLMSEIHIFDDYPQDGYTQENWLDDLVYMISIEFLLWLDISMEDIEDHQ